MFFKEYPVFVRHKELAKNQYTMIQEVNGSLIKDIYTVNIYFIENIMCTNIKEIFSAYFNKTNSVTLHPLVEHYTVNVQDEKRIPAYWYIGMTLSLQRTKWMRGNCTEWKTPGVCLASWQVPVMRTVAIIPTPINV